MSNISYKYHPKSFSNTSSISTDVFISYQISQGTIDTGWKIDRTLKDVPCEILYETKTSVDIEEKLINFLNGNYKRRLRPRNERFIYVQGLNDYI